MANIRDIIERVDDVKPNAFTDKTKLAWIGELDGKVAADVMLMGIEDIRQREYTYPDGLDAIPLVDYPHDSIYDEYLCAKIDYANGEYSKYQNTMEMFNAHYDNFINWFIRNYAPAQGYDAWNACHKGEKPPYYISAYSLAVAHGFFGTVDEWLASLKGAQVEMRCVDNVIQWRIKGDPEEAWQDLANIAQFQQAAADAAAQAKKAAAQLEGAITLERGVGEDSLVQAVSDEGLPANEATGKRSVSLGEGVKTTRDNQFGVGKYNDPTTEALVSVGNGTGDDERHNAFEVHDDAIVVNGEELDSATIKKLREGRVNGTFVIDYMEDLLWVLLEQAALMEPGSERLFHIKDNGPAVFSEGGGIVKLYCHESSEQEGVAHVCMELFSGKERQYMYAYKQPDGSWSATNPTRLGEGIYEVGYKGKVSAITLDIPNIGNAKMIAVTISGYQDVIYNTTLDADFLRYHGGTLEVWTPWCTLFAAVSNNALRLELEDPSDGERIRSVRYYY